MVKEKINVVSLFDGMSCCQIALKKRGIEVNKYFASEVDKYAMQVTMANFPNTIQIGDVRNVKGSDLGFIHLLAGGSPCQSFSFAGKRKGMSAVQKHEFIFPSEKEYEKYIKNEKNTFLSMSDYMKLKRKEFELQNTKTETIEILTLDHYLQLKSQNFEFEGQSYLFWEYMRILKELRVINPNIKFLLENVVMGKKWQKILTRAIGINPIQINSALVCAQNRNRLYWTNIPNVTIPEDKNITLDDILENIEMLNPAAIRGRKLLPGSIIGRKIDEHGVRKDYDANIPYVQCLEVRETNTTKSNCLTTVEKDNVLTSLPIGRHPDVYKNNLPYRNYTLTEYCRLQNVPEDYFKVSSEHQAKKMLGNGWTVDVIAHIFSFIGQ